jgi:hypothetical protein
VDEDIQRSFRGYQPAVDQFLASNRDGYATRGSSGGDAVTKCKRNGPMARGSEPANADATRGDGI